MKHISLPLTGAVVLLSVSSLFLPQQACAQEIILNDIAHHIDTVAHYPVGPGTTYYAVRLSRTNTTLYAMNAFILIVDTRNPYITIEEELGKDKVVGTEKPSAMAQRITTPTHIAFAGTNGDFFATSGDIGRPTGLTIENNEYAYIGGSTRRVGGVTADGRPIVATYWKYSGKVITATGDTLKIKHVNYTRNTDELVLYNQHQGTSTGTNIYGTEALVELCEGEKWTTNGKQRVVVRNIVRNTGNMTIPKGQAVLSGHGLMQQALDSLINPGDTLSIRFSLKLDDVSTALSQAIGGDNYALILDGGVAEQSNFWNEIHPRTGYGVSVTGDSAIFCVVDGRAVESYGCTTKVLGEIMHHYGAWRAVNWDGGGSSSMYIRNFGDQVNHGSDGTERAVGNGMFVIANLPEPDDTIAILHPYYPVYSMPYCGQFTPHFYGYNKYGVMLSTDVEGVVLSCDSSVGEIHENGTQFFASTRNGGSVTATYGKAQTTIEIHIAPGNMSMRYDSVIIDTRKPWQAEVVNRNVDGMQEVAPQAFEWKSMNEYVCTVSASGVLTAGVNGETMVTATMSSFTDTMLVRVETPEERPLAAETFSEPESWQVSALSGFNPYWGTAPDSTAAVRFNFSITRKPYILVEKNIVFYGLPDTVKLHYSTDAAFDNAIFTFTTATHENVPTTLSDVAGPVANGEIAIAIKEVLTNAADKKHYPLQFSSMRFYLSSSTEKGERYIGLRDITLCYEGLEITSSFQDAGQGTGLRVYPNPAGDTLTIEGAVPYSEVVFLDANGRCALKTINWSGRVNIASLPKGTYLLVTPGMKSVRVVKK